MGLLITDSVLSEFELTVALVLRLIVLSKPRDPTVAFSVMSLRDDLLVITEPLRRCKGIM